MKKAVICLALVALLGLGGQAFAELNAIDAVPAASLLLPYFEVDLNDPNGVTTIFSINNASAAPAIAHVTLWTNLSVPTLDFNVFLTGYDVYTINLRDLFVSGSLPGSTADGTGPSPVGDFSLPNNAVPPGLSLVVCNEQLPLPNLGPVRLAHIQNAHTGGPSTIFSGACSGTVTSNAVGYITVDSVNACNLLFPDQPGYFVDGGIGTANNNNLLWGDWFIVDPANNFAQGDNLVHLEAFPSTQDPDFPANGYTFYGRYVSFSGADNRESLATTWAVRYLNGGAFTGGTDLLCWRDTGLVQSPFTCGTTPNPFPLSQEQIVIFDEEENPQLIEEDPFSPGVPGLQILPCPWEVTRVEVGGVDLPAEPSFGWIYLNLSTTTGATLIDPIKQSYVTQVHDALGLFSVGYSGIALDSAGDPIRFLLPVAGNVGGATPGGSF
jgi:hypothetical protein